MKSNNFSNYNIRLYRVVDNRVRYYSIKLLPTLFSDYLLLREFGSVDNKRPTRVIKEYFSHIEDSIMAVNLLIKTKMRRGYSFG